MKSLSRPRKFYTIIALSMMVSSALLIFSVADIVTPGATCHDNLNFDGSLPFWISSRMDL